MTDYTPEALEALSKKASDARKAYDAHPDHDTLCALLEHEKRFGYALADLYRTGQLVHAVPSGDGPEAAARIQALETSLAEVEGRVKAITIALHDAIRRPMGQVPESADPFYSPAMAEQAEARRVARSQALSELAALETGEWKK